MSMPPEGTAAAAKQPTETVTPTVETTPASTTPAPVSDKPSAFAGSMFDDLGDGDETQDPAEKPSEGEKPASEGEKPTEGEKKPAAPVWPEDWREQISGGDAKFLAELRRFTTFDAYSKSTRALRQKLSSGEYKRDVPFPADGTPEQQAAWRAERGIPEDAGKYDVAIDGVTWTEADKPALDGILGRMHAINAPPTVVKEMLSFYADAVRQSEEARVEADKTFKQQAEDDLRSSYGNEYRGNMNLYKRLLTDNEAMPKDVAEIIAQARGPDGNRLMNTPSIAKWLIDQARDRYGDGGMLTGSESASLSSREDEIVKIMNSDIDRYWREKNAKGQSMADELAEIRAKKPGRRAA